MSLFAIGQMAESKTHRADGIVQSGKFMLRLSLLSIFDRLLKKAQNSTMGHTECPGLSSGHSVESTG